MYIFNRHIAICPAYIETRVEILVPLIYFVEAISSSDKLIKHKLSGFVQLEKPRHIVGLRHPTIEDPLDSLLPHSKLDEVYWQANLASVLQDRSQPAFLLFVWH
jgi:hypothetical protein